MRLGILFLTLFTGACTTVPGRLSGKFDLPLTAAKTSGGEIGMVEGEHGGFVWSSCDDLVRVAAARMVAEAKSKGASSVTGVTWRPISSTAPVCRRRWGFIALPWFLFTRLFTYAYVDGIAVKKP